MLKSTKIFICLFVATLIDASMTAFMLGRSIGGRKVTEENPIGFNIYSVIFLLLGELWLVWASNLSRLSSRMQKWLAIGGSIALIERIIVIGWNLFVDLGGLTH